MTSRRTPLPRPSPLSTLSLWLSGSLPGFLSGPLSWLSRLWARRHLVSTDGGYLADDAPAPGSVRLQLNALQALCRQAFAVRLAAIAIGAPSR